MPGTRNRPSSPLPTGTCNRYPKRSTRMEGSSGTGISTSGVTEYDFFQAVIDESLAVMEGTTDNNGNGAAAPATVSPTRKRKRTKKKTSSSSNGKNKNNGGASASGSHVAILSSSPDEESDDSSEEPPKKKLAVEKKLDVYTATTETGTASKKSMRTPPPSLLASPATPAKPTEDDLPCPSEHVLPTPPTLVHHTAHGTNLQPRRLFTQSPTLGLHQPQQHQPQQQEPMKLQNKDTTEKPHSSSNNSNNHHWTRQVHILLVILSWTYVVTLCVWSVHQRNNNNVPDTSSNICFRNNVHVRDKYKGVCAAPAAADPTTFADCPKHALCWGGQVHDCRFGGGPDDVEFDQDDLEQYYYYEYSPLERQCRLTNAVNDTLAGMIRIIEQGTMATQCGGPSADAPKPVWIGHDRPWFVLMDVVQRLSNEQHVMSPRTEEDALKLVRLVTAPQQQRNLILTFVPNSTTTTTTAAQTRMSSYYSNWFGSGTSNDNNDTNLPAAGTPLIGLNNTFSWRYSWLPLAVQCRAHGIMMPLLEATVTGDVSAKEPANATTLPNNVTMAERLEAARQYILSSVHHGIQIIRSMNKSNVIMEERLEDTGRKLLATIDRSMESMKSTTEERIEAVRTGVLSTVERINRSMESMKSITEERIEAIRRSVLSTVQRIIRKMRTMNVSGMFGTQRQHTIDGDKALHETVGMRPKWPTKKNPWSLTEWIYMVICLSGLVFTGYIQYHNQRLKRHRTWMPQVARLRELALDHIEVATNGGYVTTHLRDAVLAAAFLYEEDVNNQERRHLQRNIWPTAMKQLRDNPHVFESTVVSSTTGRAQRVLSWRRTLVVEKDAFGEEPRSQSGTRKVTICE